MILITGGTGYIGSHTYVALEQAGYQSLVLDNLSNSCTNVLDRLQRLCRKSPEFIKGDIRDHALLDDIFEKYPITAVLHFAGLKAVGESVDKPLAYYHTNVGGTLNLLESMHKAGVNTFIFSSSATVYGDPATLPIQEDAPRRATNPYGRSKLMIEDILEDICHAKPGWRCARLRYFNPVGAHESGWIGENPQNTPNNLMPYIAQVCVGRRDHLKIFGNDYPTPDGTGIRDYIHIMDLAEGHVAALNYLLSADHKSSTGHMLTVNLGSGQGLSVLEMVHAFEAASGREVPYQIVARRAGDIARCWADPSRANRLLDWKTKRDVVEMCTDTWRWQQQNPMGYE